MRSLPGTLALALFLALAVSRSPAAATLTQEIAPPVANVGDPVIVTFTVQGGSIGRIQLPTVDGLQPGGTSYQIKQYDDNGHFTTTVALSLSLIPTRAGEFTIPAFDLHTQQGEVLHVMAMKLSVRDNANSPVMSTPVATAPASPPAPDATSAAAANRAGPVVMPPPGAAPPAPPNGANPADNAAAAVTPPRDKDGGPAKVFIIITPETTNAYVGQSVPMRIDFYIRMDVNSEQNSLPTIKGSDFLMNSFMTRGHQSMGILENEEYMQETWITAIAAPKSGDFPLSMARDTYWLKSPGGSMFPFGGAFSSQSNLAHEMISSNQLTMHVLPLPEEGRPAHFTGAIGQFQVEGEAQPESVSIGEPVSLRFSVRGEGNFDYVHCPVLNDTTEWRTYVPRSGTNYLDESHTHAVKIFEQSVIPQKNGNVPLPAASFSYFNPTTKQYVTVPITLPYVDVTGTPPPLASATPDAASDSIPAPAPAAVDFLPNRVDIGSLQTSLTPIYHQPWFWGIQVAMISLPIIGALLLLLRSRFALDRDRTEEILRQRSLQQEEDAMTDAVNRNDALAFFIAARHAIQMQLGARWSVHPEALTLGEIRSHDSQLAETLQPLFVQADEVIYSGQARTDLDLAQWDRRVRTELFPSPTASP